MGWTGPVLQQLSCSKPGHPAAHSKTGLTGSRQLAWIWDFFSPSDLPLHAPGTFTNVALLSLGGTENASLTPHLAAGVCSGDLAAPATALGSRCPQLLVCYWPLHSADLCICTAGWTMASPCCPLSQALPGANADAWMRHCAEGHAWAKVSAWLSSPGAQGREGNG